MAKAIWKIPLRQLLPRRKNVSGRTDITFRGRVVCLSDARRPKRRPSSSLSKVSTLALCHKEQPRLRGMLTYLMRAVSLPLSSWNLGPRCATRRLLSTFSRLDGRPSRCALVASNRWIYFVIERKYRWELGFTQKFNALLTRQGCCGVLHDITLSSAKEEFILLSNSNASLVQRC